jgi:four helix bundle protein
MTIKSYRDLEAWQASMDVVEHVYTLTKAFPSDERFGLTAQLRRAAVSIPSNVAEGASRRTTGAFINHVSIALGSHAEAETCIEIALRLGYLSAGHAQETARFVNRAGQLLNGLMRSLSRKLP